MYKKSSLDNLLYKYSERSLEDKYDNQIQDYLNDNYGNDVNFDIDFKTFLKNKDNIEHKTILRKKRSRRIVSIIAASLIFTVLVVGPTKVATYAIEIYEKIITVLDDRTVIEYNDDNFSPVSPIEPDYIPTGYKITNQFKDANMLSITYSNNNPEESIFFDISSFGAMAITLDTENSKTYTVDFNGIEVDCIENDKANTIHCETDVQSYTISGKIKIEELFKMLETVLNKEGA